MIFDDQELICNLNNDNSKKIGAYNLDEFLCLYSLDMFLYL